MAESADAHASGACGLTPMGVQLPLSAPEINSRCKTCAYNGCFLPVPGLCHKIILSAINKEPALTYGDITNFWWLKDIFVV